MASTNKSKKKEKVTDDTCCSYRGVHKPNAWIDAVLTSIFFIEVMAIMYFFRDDTITLMILGACFVCAAVCIEATKWIFSAGGFYFSKVCLRHLGHPLRKKTTLKKFEDQSWQLMIHAIMAIMEYYILNNETWWDEPLTMWEPNVTFCAPKDIKPYVKLLYLAQLATYFYIAFSCKFVEEIRKDYIVMMTHHVVTIALVGGSYVSQFVPVGVTVFFLHDASDIPLDMLKMVNYLKMEGLQGFFATEILFVILVIDWFYYRIFLFPTKLIYSAIVEAKIKCPATLGLSWYILSSLLIVLWCLHIWWGFLILRLLVRSFSKGTHEAAEEEYEGLSSDSDTEKDKTE